MNILIVGDTIPADKPGGGGTYLWEVSQRLAQKGHQVFVLIQRHNPGSPVHEKTDNVQIYRFDYRRNGSLISLIDRFRACRRIFEHLSQELHFDLINIHFALGGFSIIRSPKSRSIPCLYTFQGPWSGESLIEDQRLLEDKSLLGKFSGMFKTGIAFRLKAHIEKSIFARVDHFLVLSRFNKNILIEEFRISPQNITIIPSGVNTERFIPTGDKKSAKAALGIPADLRVLLTVRRLTARMGLEDLVRAMRTVVQERRALLIIGGTGHLKNRLMSLVNEYDLADNIEFAGHIPEKNLPLYYQAADLFVLPSLCYEGFGLVTLEALSSGLPIIGTATGGTNEILASLDPQLLVEAARPDILAQKIITILDSKEYDPNTLHQFAEDNHSWNAIFPRIETLFAKTTGSI